MDTMGSYRKNSAAGLRASESDSLLKSSPNILENFPYDDFKLKQQQQRMTSPPLATAARELRSKSPVFCETLRRHAFIANVINTQPSATTKEKESVQRRSLEDLEQDIRKIDKIITATEHVLKQEKEREREHKAKRSKTSNSPNKENKSPSPKAAKSANTTPTPITYKINSFKKRPYRSKPGGSPRFLKSKLYFRNGRIVCLEAEKQLSNVECTHALVKQILKYEHEKPLVSPESVRRVLSTPSKAPSVETVNVVPLPGEIIEIEAEVCKVEPRRALLEGDCQSGGGAGHGPQPESPPTEETCDSSSQPIVDEDEQDVQICYDELPEVANDEQNLGPPTVDNYLASEIVAVDDDMQTQAHTQAQINVHENRLSSAGSLDSAGQQFLRDQVRHLVRRFTARANKVKSHLEMPPTPSSSPSPPPTAQEVHNTSTVSALNSLKKLDKKPPQPVTKKSPNHRGRMFEADTPRSNVWLCSSLCGSNNDERTLDPQGKIYISWLCVVSLSFLYNAWVIPMRSTFPVTTPGRSTNIWLICDFCADIIYLLDVVFFKHRIMYLFEGFWVKNKNLTRKNYMRKLQFKLDLLSLLPLELLYFKFGTEAVYLRFPRLFKIQSFWEVFKLLDRVISSPHFVRVAKTMSYMLYMIHLTACAYYAYSKYEGLGSNRWVFSGKGHPYVRCFAFATKTATSIGKNPKPEHEGEYLFMTAAWLMGVFVFALLIGQIRDIISTATRNKNEYRQLEDETLEYMRRLNLPTDVQRRVKMWFKFTWDQQRTLDESNILDSLPINLKTDIAISVHIQTLSKVQLFADCEEALLRDLVLKLRAVTFLPGDCVCRKGEVGREMYIIKLGQVQVMGGPSNDVVLATLYEGSVFGEISLLGINGADRRTADVRAKGYANLFVLSKSDLNEVIAYYPNAQAILKKRARTLMRKNAAREREEAAQTKPPMPQADVVIGNPKTPENPPKLLQTVIQALPYESPAVMLITRGSKRTRRRRQSPDLETIVDKKMPDLSEGVTRPPTNWSRDSFILPGGARSQSPDLLLSIQNELKHKHKFINLTDSEKALIVSNSNASITHGRDEARDDDDDDDDDVEIIELK